ncbi:hypothetical protein PAXRUDRAFT_330926 [Paxillus rubicundulus Ve08.2h10]|uniref:Unplaced genomic scaffold scaffold_18, whole genome shotgun sequence n=1 Tax=Paxillus rubicundulus Ve08.2h10 TaxID=930991 RepID=A0A0D0DMW5_9AGAM|nr:hypothetical protein PAXRUDRAFT_330926 [Paxillus rubicundulus Ve08.2h10]
MVTLVYPSVVLLFPLPHPPSRPGRWPASPYAFQAYQVSDLLSIPSFVLPDEGPYPTSTQPLSSDRSFVHLVRHCTRLKSNAYRRSRPTAFVVTCVCWNGGRMTTRLGFAGGAFRYPIVPAESVGGGAHLGLGCVSCR